MRKAASHKVGTVWTAAMCLAVVILLASVTRAAAYSLDPNEVPVGDQDVNDGAIGFITINGTQAKATVENIGDAPISGGLASYKKVDDNTDNQILFDSVIYSLDAHSKKDLTINLPCWGQVDLFKGDVLQSFSGGARYGSRLIAAVHTKDECATATPSATPSEAPSSTPTPTPVVTPSATPGQGGGNPTPTPTTTATPAPTSTPTPAPSATPTPTETPNGGGGNNGGSTPSGQVLGSSVPKGGLTLPSTGGTNYDYLVFAGYILAAGVSLRKYAHSLEK